MYGLQGAGVPSARYNLIYSSELDDGRDTRCWLQSMYGVYNAREKSSNAWRDVLCIYRPPNFLTAHATLGEDTILTRAATITTQIGAQCGEHAYPAIGACSCVRDGSCAVRCLVVAAYTSTVNLNLFTTQRPCCFLYDYVSSLPCTIRVQATSLGTPIAALAEDASCSTEGSGADDGDCEISVTVPSAEDV